MGKKYIIPIEADPSALKKGVAEANAALTDLGNNKVVVDIDYDHGDINDIRKALDAISAYNPKIKVQLDYDLFSAVLKRKQEEYTKKNDLYKLVLGEQKGSGELSDYISDILKEVDDGLYNGLPKKGLEESLKKAFDLAASYRETTGKNIDDGTIDYMSDLQEEFKSLEDYDPKINLFDDLESSTKRDSDIIKGLTLQLEDLKKQGAIDTGDIFDASGAEKVKNEIRDVANTLGKISEIKTVSIFDGVSEQIYDVEKDADALEKKLKELADRMEMPVFHAGDLRKGVVNGDNFLPGDSLAFTIDRGTGKTAGTGHFSASNLVDVLDWKNAHEGEGFDRGIFAYDLSKYGKMLKIPNSDYYSNLLDFFGDIHNLISDGIADTPEWYGGGKKKKYSDYLKGRNYEDIFNEYKSFFSDFGVSLDEFGSFIQSERGRLKQLKDSSKSYDDFTALARHEDAFGTRFLKRFTNYRGIDATNLDMDDSTAIGSLVFSLDKNQPYDINFNGNDKVARQFYGMVLSKILSKKALNSDVEVEDLLTNFIDEEQESLIGDVDKKNIQRIIEENAKKARDYTFKSLNKQDLTSSADSNDAEQIKSKHDTSDSAEEEAQANIRAADAIQQRIERLERLQQLQQTISNMKPETAYGKSYEEAGQHIEKLNAQYEQTVAEIGKLRAADDGSQQIREQIGLLENLAVAYKDAINASIPNDVSPGQWLSKYTNIPRNEYFDDEAKFDRIKRSAEEFRKSIDQEILDTYRDGPPLPLPNQEVINTSALSEIQEILERINSAGKEATQTMEQFHAAVSEKESGDIGSVSNSEVESLREQLSQAQADAEAERRRAQDAEEKAADVEREVLGYEHENSQLSNELDEARKALSERQSATEGTSGIGSVSDSEVESLREQLSRAQEDAEAERIRAENEHRRAEDAEGQLAYVEQDVWTYEHENNRLQVELSDLKNDLIERQVASDASDERIRELERSLSLKEDLYAESVADQREANERADEYEELNKELQRKITDLEKKQSDNGETTDSFAAANAGLADSTNQTISTIDSEKDAFNSLGSAAVLAATNKNILTREETTLGSATTNTTALIRNEIEALNQLGSAAKGAATNKSALAKAEAAFRSATTNTPTENESKIPTGDADDDTGLGGVYRNVKNKFSHLKEYINSNPALSKVYSSSLQSLEDKLGKLPLDSSSITDFISELDKLKSAAEATRKDVVAEAKQISDSYKNLFNGRSELFKSFENAVKGGNKSSFQQYLDTLSKLDERIDKLQSKYGNDAQEVQNAISARDTFKTNMSTFFSNRFNTEINESIDKIQKAISTRANQGSGYIKEYREELEGTLTSLQLLKQKLSPGEMIDASDIQRYVEMLNAAKQTMKGLTDQSKILTTRNDVAKLLGKVTKDIESSNLSGDTLNGYLELQNVLRQILNDADSAADGLTNVSKAAELLNAETFNRLHETMIDQGMNRPKFIDQFRTAVMNQSAQFLGTYFSLQDLIRYGREMVQTVTQLDSNMIELKKVSGETDKRLEQSFKNSTATAREYGATISDIIQSTADWSRAGYEIDEAEQLAAVTQLYQNVGDNLSQETASEYLISTMRGFQIDSSEATSIVDKMNEVANNFSIDTAGIGEALERSAASFYASGTSLDKSIALVTATSEVTQDPASAGTMWKTNKCLNVQKCA